MINNAQIVSNTDLINQYYKNIHELSSNIHANTTISAVIEDYKAALSILRSKQIAVNDCYNQKLVIQLLAKIKSIGIKNWELQSKEYNQYSNYLFEEISKKDRKLSTYFQRVLSNSFIGNTNKKVINTLYTGIAHYVEIMVNTHQFTKTTIIQNSRIGNTYFIELEKLFTDNDIGESLRAVQEFLNEAVQDIIDANNFRKL
jgi:sulfatase maturation enzyme AslB (radical SAM superfamily)